MARRSHRGIIRGLSGQMSEEHTALVDHINRPFTDPPKGCISRPKPKKRKIELPPINLPAMMFGNELTLLFPDIRRNDMLLGEGNFGCVHRVRLDGYPGLALKSYFADHSFKLHEIMAHCEYALLKSLPTGLGPAVYAFTTLQEFGIHITENGQMVKKNVVAATVMELITGNSVCSMYTGNKVGAASKFKFWLAMTDLFRDLATMHKLGFVHRDIHPRNCIITPEGQLRIVDFGNVGFFNTKTPMSLLNPLLVMRVDVVRVSSLSTFAPELYDLKNKAGPAIRKCLFEHEMDDVHFIDVWDAGSIGVAMLTGYADTKSQESIILKIRAGNRDWFNSLEPEIREFMSQILCPMVTRFTAEQAYQVAKMQLVDSCINPDR